MNNIYKILFVLFFCLDLKSSNLYNKNINEISESFLGNEYKSNTLKGSKFEKEQLVINLKQVDCFTYLDYVSAFNISLNQIQFEKNLIKLRYKNAIVSYENRNHFFTDWIENNSYTNISYLIANTKKTLKYLNKKNDGFYLDGIKIKKRLIEYIPKENLKNIDYSKFKDGDLLGIYSKKIGLDVTHVGFLIKKQNIYYLRHASLKYKKVIDENLKTYLENKNGLIVLRNK